ncbi:MAG: bifunctional phosphopantothenoylcysteine decarboxylase/phosphopantothenate--cysteine ligase CoaBC [Proteobacteria bacterium]|nr:bifunctional phosphopantothenoylcysteine decarboxylase/phosphopantothenate--cysteine ligase CoaBC [Desulfobulbaceae bacterium]MBU4153839.1 bifunctional phosphopantothenoylcysteine decarboxylase/phosphopantothenate--cysteine ligase CoaBC [Pseudomonadota bacterium]
MSHPFTDKHILFGITGGIAAYKAADWIRALRQRGAEVTVVMTESATRFVTPLTFAALSGNKVECEIFDSQHPESIAHITLAKKCDLMIIAPATANTIARLAHGMADTLLSTIALATQAKVLVFPAMNSAMYLHPATQNNITQLTTLDYTVIPPDCGSMACGDHGPGRLPEWSTAEAAIATALSAQDLTNQHILITAGPTQEPLDPVRFISNRSTGKMGYALASAACQRGAMVTLISGPSNLPPPIGVEIIQVRTALEMRQAVFERYHAATVIIKTAAVSDFRPNTISDQKIKKVATTSSCLDLTANPDILYELGAQKGKDSRPLLVGFAAESENHIKEGLRKLASKNLDLMIVNDILRQDTGFAADTNQVIIIDKNGGTTSLPLLSKEETSHRILDRISQLI